jgi:hypothetical protein
MAFDFFPNSLDYPSLAQDPTGGASLGPNPNPTGGASLGPNPNPAGGATLGGPGGGGGASFQQPSGILAQFLAANQPQGSLPPMPPRRPMSLGVPGGNGGGSAGAGVPLPPRRPYDLGQPVGSPMQLPGGYRPEGPPATSAQGGPFSGIHPFDALKALFGQGQPGGQPPADGTGAGSQAFANAHPRLPFSQNQLRNNNPNGNILGRLAGLFGQGGLFGGGGGGSTDYGVGADIGGDIIS